MDNTNISYKRIKITESTYFHRLWIIEKITFEQISILNIIYNILLTKNHRKVRPDGSGIFLMFFLRSASCPTGMLELFPWGNGPYLYPNKYIPINESNVINAKPVKSHMKLIGLSEKTSIVPIGCIDIAPIVFPTPKINIQVFDMFDNLWV